MRMQLDRKGIEKRVQCIAVTFFALEMQDPGERRVKDVVVDDADLQRTLAKRLHFILTSPSQHHTRSKKDRAPRFVPAQ